MDHHQDHDGRNKMDLSLKLGLPYQNDDDDNQHVNHHVNPDYSNHLPNFNFINPYIAHNYQQLASDSRMINGGGQAANAIGMVNLATPNAINHGMSNIANNMANMNLNANSALSWPNNYYGSHHLLPYNNTPAVGSVVGIPVMPHHHQYGDNFNYGDHTISSGSSASSAPSSSSNSQKKDSRRQRPGNYIDTNRRCTNSNCNTNDTPMWRKGPLGPKTLCNACGIKYRKEVARKRAKDEAELNNSNNNA